MAVSMEQKEKFVADLAIFLIDLKADIKNGKYGSVFEDVTDQIVWMDGYKIKMLDVCSACDYYAGQPKEEIDMEDLIYWVQIEMIEDMTTGEYIGEEDEDDAPEIIVTTEGFLNECMNYRSSEVQKDVEDGFFEVVEKNGMGGIPGDCIALLYERE